MNNNDNNDKTGKNGARYGSYWSPKQTPQRSPIPGRNDMVTNSEGGYVFAISPWDRLSRFLILGTMGGTFYAGERELTVENAEAILPLVEQYGRRVVDTVVSVSDEGRAPSNDPALFVLAIAASFGSTDTRKYALERLNKVARIGTHLFTFAKYVKEFRGLGGRAMRTAISHWYNDKSEEFLAYQLLKYQSRYGWSHRDLLRLAHPAPKNSEVSRLFNWAINGLEYPGKAFYPNPGHSMSQIVAFEWLKEYPSAANAVRAIADHRLTREMIPTELLNSREVWEALLERMPMKAMVRNLGNMSKIDLLVPMSDAEKKVISVLGNEEMIAKSRLHPLAILTALSVYSSGGGVLGSGVWHPCPRVVDALDEAFYLSFGSVVPTGKRIMISLDVSGSMGAKFSSSPLSCCEAATALALVTASVESDYIITRFNRVLEPVPLTPRMRMDTALRYTRDINAGGTDCSVPMTYATEKMIDVDAFIVITDNETYAGRIHPCQALARYRAHTGIPAKLIVVGMTSEGFSIADSRDPLMVDMVGFDTSTPAAISEFIRA